MSVPRPPLQLEGHCAAVNNNTLYVLSPTGFQSLSIQKKAQWVKEPNGVLVTGPACVKVGNETDAALYVIGGQTPDESFSGLQRFNFADKSWETLPSSSSDVIKQRTDHSVAYLRKSKSILVYAGSQPDAPSQLSSQTFVIATEPPYIVNSFTSSAPPANLPILQSWEADSAIMLGGAPGNTDIYTFHLRHGWRQYGTNLTSAPSSSTRGTILPASGGARVLELYDFGVTPNTVSQFVLQGTDRQPAPPGTTPGVGSTQSLRRSLPLNNWPTYNATNAPNVVRSDYSVSLGEHGLAVIAGGSSAMPVALFNQDENSWVNADSFFDSPNVQKPLQPSSTPTATPTAPSNTSSATAAASASKSNTLRTLGIVLGVLCGLAVVFILALLYLKYRQRQRRKQQGEEDEKADRMSFQDRGAASFLAGGATAPITNQGPNPSLYGPHGSLAMIGEKLGNKRNTNHQMMKNSFDSTSNLVQHKDAAAGEPVEMVALGIQGSGQNSLTPSAPAVGRYGSTLTVDESDAKARRKRSSGWSKYFATSVPTGPNGLSHIPDAYRDSRQQSTIITSGSLLPALDLGVGIGSDVDGSSRLSHVATGSPSFNDSREDIAKYGSSLFSHEGQTGLIVDPSRPRSTSESISSYAHSTVSSMMTSEYYNETGQTAWTPTRNPSMTFKDYIITGRHTSSIYSTGTYENRVPSRGKSAGFFPGAGTSYRPPRKQKAKEATSEVSMLDWPTPPKRPESLTQKNEPLSAPQSAQTATVPSVSPVAEKPENDSAVELGRATTPSDLTWLDLGSNAAVNQT